MTHRRHLGETALLGLVALGVAASPAAATVYPLPTPTATTTTVAPPAPGATATTDVGGVATQSPQTRTEVLGVKLPATGSELTAYLLAGAALVGGGTVLVVAGHRRRSSTED